MENAADGVDSPTMDQIPDERAQIDRSAGLHQRIGERYKITVPISFAPPPVGRWRSKPKPTEVITEDWSYTGLGFVTETRDDLRESAPVQITIGPVTGRAQVRVVRPAADPEMSHYGVAFRDQELEDVARELITIHLDRVPEDRKSRGPVPEIPEPYEPDQSVWT